MNYRGTDKDGKKYFVEIRGKHIIISTGDSVLDLIAEDFYGYDKNGRAVFENDTITLPKKKFHFQFGNVTFTAKGEEIVVPDFKKAGLTRGMISQIIQGSELKEAKQ
ncbi:MAG: hypothetical protein IKP64_00335 [Selenomonadaceae bacterium]|nr:hypothetical protein [Selenomonadaceae bacterium]MBR4381983.1 hypothetical protein [Selenomonadaceae bacterium]